MPELVIPLGPVLCYSWWHEWPRRPEAVLCLEQKTPFRLNFIQYTDDGKKFSESGWIGQWSEDVCTQTVIRRQKVIQEAGGHIITLMGLHYRGLYADWYHNGVWPLWLRPSGAYAGEDRGDNVHCWNCISPAYGGSLGMEEVWVETLNVLQGIAGPAVFFAMVLRCV